MISSTSFSIAQRPGIATLSPDDLEQVFRDLAGDGALPDQVNDRSQLGGRNRRGDDRKALLVKPPEQLIDHPIGGKLAVPFFVPEPGKHRFEEVSALALSNQNTRVIRRQAKL